MQTSPWPMQSGQVLLREATDDDIVQVLTFRNLPEVNDWTLVTYADPDEYRRSWREMRDDDRKWACVADLDGTVVAFGSLEIIDALGQPGTPLGTDAEIGYIVDPRYAGRGIATDIARGLLAACFDRLHLRRAIAGCYADNLASVRILEKVGMRREQHGVEDSWHVTRGWIDGYTYGLLASEWRAANPT